METFDDLEDRTRGWLKQHNFRYSQVGRKEYFTREIREPNTHYELITIIYKRISGSSDYRHHGTLKLEKGKNSKT